MSLKLLSWNVNGIRAARRKGFVDWFEKTGFDILCLQETRAHTEQLTQDLLKIDGYYIYFSKPIRKGYSGVALYTQIKPKKINYNLGIEKFDQEGRMIEAEFENFILYNVYFPNGQMSQERLNYKMEFYDEFLKYIEKKRKKGKNIVVCGDVNTAHEEIDLARPKANVNNSGFLKIEREWIDKLLNKGYIDTFRYFHPDAKDEYTYWSMRTAARQRNVGWRIDYFFVNKEMKKYLQNADILSDIMGSDHCPISLELNL